MILESVNGIQTLPVASSVMPSRKDKRGILSWLKGTPAPPPPDPYWNDWPSGPGPYDPYGPPNPYGPGPGPYPPSGPAPPPNGPFLGAHYHTTITKKIGVPYPVPYKVRSSY